MPATGTPLPTPKNRGCICLCRVQINKLSKYMKSSIIWSLGVILTLFVGVLSLEGTLTASVDGITAKTAKAAVSSLIPVVRQNIRRWSR